MWERTQKQLLNDQARYDKSVEKYDMFVMRCKWAIVNMLKKAPIFKQVFEMRLHIARLNTIVPCLQRTVVAARNETHDALAKAEKGMGYCKNLSDRLYNQRERIAELEKQCKELSDELNWLESHAHDAY